ncbi:MAG: hypothetical protein WBG38_18720 [Nodosilinea sp.]
MSTKPLSTRNLEQAKSTVYDYIGSLARHALPEIALVEFYSLIHDRIAVGYQEVVASLDQIIQSDGFRQEDGLRFLNRSFYTICNPWHLNGEMMPCLEQLITHLDELPEPAAHSPLTRLLRRRLRDFNQGNYGDCLHRQMRLGEYAQASPTSRPYRGVLGDHLADYFYLYRSTTRTPDIEDLERSAYDDPLQSGLGYKQSQKLEEMYRAVSEYRRLREQGVTGLVNPTRLPVAEFEQGLDDYYYKRPSGFTPRAVALDGHIQSAARYGICRSVIQDYLMTAIEPLPQSSRDKLYRDFFRELRLTDDQAPMAVSTAITLFTRLLNTVLLPVSNASGVLRFQQYVDKLGPASITKVLLSLVLAQPMIRFDLERKLGYLYRFFEEKSLKSVAWVVNFFEHVNLALIMNAKRIGYFSLVTQLPNLDSV